MSFIAPTAVLWLLTSSAAIAGDGLLVVTPAALRASVEPYAAFKRERRPVEVLVLENAVAKYAGVDDAEKLKRAIYDAWKRGGIGHVLLVGDADVLPVRYMALDRNTDAAFNYAFYPSDLYYGDLAKPDGSFDDWNGAKEGYHGSYFGEINGEHHKDTAINFDGIDYLPEVGFGRWPASDAASVARIVETSMTYEAAVEKKEIPTRAAFVHVDGWVDARERVWSWGETIAPTWRVERRFFRGGDTKFDTRPPTEPEVLGLLNDGTSLIVHAGHGNDDVWEKCLNVKSIPEIRNQGRAIVMSAGCSTARFATLPPYEAYADHKGVEHTGTNAGQVFTQPPPPPSCYAKGGYNLTGLGERLVREGRAAVYIGCNTGSQPCGLTLAEGFVDAVAKGGDKPLLVGDCWTRALRHYWDAEHLATITPTESWYPASIFFQGMKFMVFGDPSLPIPR